MKGAVCRTIGIIDQCPRSRRWRAGIRVIDAIRFDENGVFSGVERSAGDDRAETVACRSLHVIDGPTRQTTRRSIQSDCRVASGRVECHIVRTGPRCFIWRRSTGERLREGGELLDEIIREIIGVLLPGAL